MSHTSPRQRITTAAMLLAVLVTVFEYYRIVWGSLGSFVVAVDHYDTLFCDFVDHFYPMGRRIFVFPWPVEGFYYTAFFSIALRPMGALSLASAL